MSIIPKVRDRAFNVVNVFSKFRVFKKPRKQLTLLARS